MTALGGRDVKRIFSAVDANSAGLPGHKTHEACGKDFGDFGEVLGSG
jgi:hypothetical protein